MRGQHGGKSRQLMQKSLREELDVALATFFRKTREFLSTDAPEMRQDTAERYGAAVGHEVAWGNTACV